MARLLQSIKLTITCLDNMPIRRPGPPDRLEQNIPYVKGKFPKLNQEVATRSGEVVACRRQLPVYGLSHHECLGIPGNLPGIVIRAPPIAEQEKNKIRAAGSGHTALHINTPEVETPQVLCPPSAAGLVWLIQLSETGEALHLEVPPRPKGENGMELEIFKCQYCLEPQTIETDYDWK